MQKLAVYDFDGTLFRSPEQPSWWSTGYWFGHERSLNPPCIPEKPGPEWWNLDVVEAAIADLEDPETITLLLTGRGAKEANFSERVPELLRQQDLEFDEVLLRPGGKSKEWKLVEILERLEDHPEIEWISLWDDREEHLEFIRENLEDIGYQVEAHLVDEPLQKCGGGDKEKKQARCADTGDSTIGMTHRRKNDRLDPYHVILFAENEERNWHYGPHVWTLQTELPEIPYEVIEFAARYYNSTPEEIFDEVNPPNIVSSAGVWDSPEFVYEVWEKFGDPGYRTLDGAVVLDRYAVDMTYHYDDPELDEPVIQTKRVILDPSDVEQEVHAYIKEMVSHANRRSTRKGFSSSQRADAPRNKRPTRSAGSRANVECQEDSRGDGKTGPAYSVTKRQTKCVGKSERADTRAMGQATENSSRSGSSGKGAGMTARLHTAQDPPDEAPSEYEMTEELETEPGAQWKDLYLQPIIRAVRNRFDLPEGSVTLLSPKKQTPFGSDTLGFEITGHVRFVDFKPSVDEFGRAPYRFVASISPDGELLLPVDIGGVSTDP